MLKCINRESSNNHGRVIPPFYIPPEAPLDPGSFGVNIRLLVRSSQTDYQYTCVETALAPKTLGPSPHFHKDLDEISLVLEGTLSVMVEGDVFEVPAGGMQMRPRGLVHTFWNGTDKPVRFLDMFLNQNFDDYLEEFFRIMNHSARDKSESRSLEVAKRFAELDLEFGVTQYHERRKDIIDKYGLTGRASPSD